ncbi:MAG: hypothetical protein HY242_11125 [Afipia sp.]|nr:hypothetical protein [Afipia sp.]
MFHKLMDDFRESTGTALRLTSLAAAVAVSLFITTGFLCAAAFVFVLERYGLMYACLAGAAVFFLTTLLAAACYAIRKRQVQRKPVEAAKEAKSALQTALSDPMIVAAGLQIVRSVGVSRLVPLLAVGGIALGVMANRRSAEAEPAE